MAGIVCDHVAPGIDETACGFGGSEIDGIDRFPQAYVSGNPIFKGIFEDNDRRKRLMAIINYNTDVSQYWEWSGRGFRPFDQTNEAYKLGVNYLIYGLTH